MTKEIFQLIVFAALMQPMTTYCVEPLMETGRPSDSVTEKYEIEIQCSNIPSSGIASAYGTYLFTLSNYASDVTDSSWEYLVKATSGDYECMSQQSGGQTFQITPSSVNINTAYINASGNLEGLIQYTYTRGGTEYKALYKLTLEYKPVIWDVSDQKAHFGSYANLYNYSFSVSYAGTENLTIGVEQEYSALYDTYHVHEPELAHVYLTNLNCGNKVWVDISASNSYGSTTYTLEIPEQNSTKTNVESLEAQQDGAYVLHDIDYINLYSVNGSFLGRVHSISELPKTHDGIVILEYHDKDGHVIGRKTVHSK